MVSPVSINLAVFFSVAMFSWWIYVTGHITTLGDIIKSGFSPDFFIHAPTEVIAYLNTVPIFELLFNQLGLFLFFSISLIGFFYMISRKYSNSTMINYAIAGIVPLAIGFFSLVIGTYIIPDRWWYFSQILLAVSVSISLIMLYNSMKSRFAKPIFLVLITIFISFLMIMSPEANVDNPIFSPNTGVRLAMTESEMTGTTFFMEKSVHTLLLDSDFSNVVANYYYLHNPKIEPLDSYLLKGQFNISDRTIILRNILVDEPFRLFGQPYKLNYDPKQSMENQGLSCIYDCKSISCFFKGVKD